MARASRGARRAVALAVLLVLIGDGLLGFWWWKRRREHRHDPVILAAARAYGMDPALVKAVVWRESRFDHEVLGRAGEVGLMQIRTLAAREWAEAEKIRGFDMPHLLSPRTNTLAGTWYLKRLLNRYAATDRAIVYALADYNAGRMNVLKWSKGSASTNSEAFLGQIGFPMTRKYVDAVLERAPQYAGDFSAQTKTTPVE